MSRRDLIIKTASLCGLAAATGTWGYLFYSDEPVRKSDRGILTFKDYRTEAGLVYPDLAVVHGRDPEKMVRAAMDKIGGISRFVKPGEKVLIKPNVAWDRQPEQAANTNPIVVGAVVRLCIEAGAKDVWVTDVPVNDPYRCFARSGIEEAVKKAGGRTRIASDSDFVMTDLKGETLKRWPVSAFYHQADRLINLPIVKHHSLSKCTMGMKNLYGSLGGQRNRLHQDINSSISDLASAIRPTLTILDATRILMRNGPTGGDIADVLAGDTVIAGVDLVAVETWGLRYLGFKIEDVPFIGMAERRGVGRSDLAGMNIAEFNV